MSFTDVFGGENRSPAQLDLAIMSITADTTLTWPWQTGTSSNVAAHKIEVSANAGLSITLPYANRASVGEDITFKNTGANSFNVKDAAGNIIGTVASGEVWIFYIRTNGTIEGSWGSWQMGIGTSSATAASLAGAGLYAGPSNDLNQMAPATTVAVNRTMTDADRAGLFISTGGSITFTFDPVADLNVDGSGWFVFVRNQGSGTLTLAPSSELIDGDATKILQIDESCVVMTTATGFATVGYGRAIDGVIFDATIDLAGSGNINLNYLQVRSQIQDYTGILTGARTVTMGTDPGYWFVRNNTSGAYTVTFRVNSGDPGVAVAQGTYSILRSDGAEVKVALTTTTGTVTSIASVAGDTVLTPDPIIATGTVGLATTAVTPGTYGDQDSIPAVTVDSKGRITGASNVPLGYTGDIKFSIATTPATGWILAYGTIGSAASAATNRANADTEALYTLLWDAWADGQAPVSGGRGASAAADFAANKTIAVPDLRGTLLAGLDNMGGSARSQITSPQVSPNGSTPGATGGAQTQTADLTAIPVTGTTSGSQAVTVTGTTDQDLVNVSTAAFAAGVNFSMSGHLHDFTGTGTTDGAALTVAGTADGTTDSWNNLPPLMMLPIHIKL